MPHGACGLESAAQNPGTSAGTAALVRSFAQQQLFRMVHPNHRIQTEASRAHASSLTFCT
eukprot:4682996-Pleurochrysis_carterae.AAC.1